MWTINRKFLNSSFYITDLKLCSIRLFNNEKFPWIILIPKRKGITDITDLKSRDQKILMQEIVFCSKIMKKIFKSKKLNVEKIGNVVPQLHIHIIARYNNDVSWPLSVWVVKANSYSKSKKQNTLNKIISAFK